MLKKTIAFKDFDGNDRTDVFYFNMTEAELVRQEMMETKTDGEGNVIGEGFRDRLQKIIASNDGGQILPQFESIIRMSIGEKSEDGRFFEKSPQISSRFINSAAYHQLFLEFLTDPQSAAEFINGVVPAETSGRDAAIARARSEAAMQGHKATAERWPQPSPEVSATTDDQGNNLFKNPAPLLDSERAELEALRAAQGSQTAQSSDAYTSRPPHETGPGFQQQ